MDRRAALCMEREARTDILANSHVRTSVVSRNSASSSRALVIHAWSVGARVALVWHVTPSSVQEDAQPLRPLTDLGRLLSRLREVHVTHHFACLRRKEGHSYRRRGRYGRPCAGAARGLEVEEVWVGGGVEV